MRFSWIDIGAAVAIATIVLSANAARAGESRWNHNGSVIRWMSDGAAREARYDEVRPAISSTIASGDVLFKGRNEQGTISGTAYVFKKGCKPAPYKVSGEADASGKSFELTGDAPVFASSGCSIARRDANSSNGTLKFDLIEPPARVATSDSSNDDNSQLEDMDVFLQSVDIRSNYRLSSNAIRSIRMRSITIKALRPMRSSAAARSSTKKIVF